MTGFDFALAGILLVSLLFGLWRGLVYEALSLLGWPVAFVLSKLFAGSVAPLIPALGSADETPGVSSLLSAYVLVFIVALIAWSVLVLLLSKLVKAIGLGLLDRVLGGAFGVLRGVLVILVLVWMAGLTKIPAQPFWRDAMMSRTAEDAALLTKVWLPDNIAQRIHYGIRR